MDILGAAFTVKKLARVLLPIAFVAVASGLSAARAQERPDRPANEWNTMDDRAPKKGDVAPDFTLKSIDGKSEVTLSDFRDKKPVVLIFGSWT